MILIFKYITMRKILLIFVLAFVTNAAYSQNLNEDQKTLREKIISKLNEKQLKPEIDIDGSVYFQKDGKDFSVSVDPQEEVGPFLISMYYGDTYDSEGKGKITKNNMANVLPSLNKELSCVKVILDDDFYLIQSEMYTYNALVIEKMIADINMALEKIKSQYFMDLVKDYDETLEEIELRKEIESKKEFQVSIPDASGDSVTVKMILVDCGSDADGNVGYNFRIGETEVTQRLWYAVMGENPSCNKQEHFKVGKDYPVENVTYTQVKEFIDKLNAMTSYHFRLPTSKEWIFAAKGGIKSNGYEYSGNMDADRVAVFSEPEKNIKLDKTSPVKSKGPKGQNELGLYDMSGNVYEWCQDGPEGNESRKYTAGGCYKTNRNSCRIDSITDKDVAEPQAYVGFRLVMDLLK